jgi:hypothetical protein
MARALHERQADHPGDGDEHARRRQAPDHEVVRELRPHDDDEQDGHDQRALEHEHEAGGQVGEGSARPDAGGVQHDEDDGLDRDAAQDVKRETASRRASGAPPPGSMSVLPVSLTP